jgi:ribonucleoside-diphosphate reductase alpha chain
MDYIFRWLGAKFLSAEYAVSEAGETTTLRPTETDPQQELPFTPFTSDAPLCAECGSIMTRNGSCYKCGKLRRHKWVLLSIPSSSGS